ncbi:ATP:cob(I)alamin adenosyltransferase [Thermoflexus sp.]|uniref:ATP:cob(I)alamin adenosyltransferase n=1 Tax=Thermoflexus sp. TaxID=1969742 RepID=UPI0035E3F8B3
MSLYRPDFEPWKPNELQTRGGRTIQRTDLRLDSPLLELNAWLGLARACAHSARVQAILLALQRDLQQMLKQLIALDDSPNHHSSFLPMERIGWLDEIRETLERERSTYEFPDLPGDTVSGAILDLLSIITQRISSQLHQTEGQIDPTIEGYLERLPRLLFALARYEEAQAAPQR